MKHKPKPTQKRLYHAFDATGKLTEIKALDLQDALTQAFKLTRAVVKVEAAK